MLGGCVWCLCGVVQTRVGKGNEKIKGNSYLVSRVSLLHPQFSKKLTQHSVIINKTLSPSALSFLIFRAKNKALFNNYSFHKQKIKSCNAKWRRQRKQSKKVVKNNFHVQDTFFVRRNFPRDSRYFTLDPRQKVFIAVVLTTTM